MPFFTLRLEGLLGNIIRKRYSNGNAQVGQLGRLLKLRFFVFLGAKSALGGAADVAITLDDILPSICVCAGHVEYV